MMCLGVLFLCLFCLESVAFLGSVIQITFHLVNQQPLYFQILFLPLHPSPLLLGMSLAVIPELIDVCSFFPSLYSSLGSFYCSVFTFTDSSSGKYNLMLMLFSEFLSQIVYLPSLEV